MDGLSAAASVIAVIQVTSKVFDLCRTYYIHVKNARHDIQRLRQDITSLQDMLINILDLLESEGGKSLSALETIVRQDGPLQQCHSELMTLVATLGPEAGQSKLSEFMFKAVRWPLSSKEVDAILISVERYKSSFILGLTVAEANLSLEVLHNVAEVKSHLESRMAGEARDFITRWLATTDPSSNLHAASRNHQPGTGQWLLDSAAFKQWSNYPNSLLWISGIPGCGKTTLSSTIIQHLKTCCSISERSVLAYYFFDFKASAKQEVSSCLSSLVAQLCDQIVHLPTIVKKTYERSSNGKSQPSLIELRELLSEIFQELDCVFIIIDALDECSRQNERQDILATLAEIKSWNNSSLHVLVTSRPEPDIESSLLPHLSQAALQVQGVDIESDIRSHIMWQLSTDPKLKVWPKDVRAEIKDALLRGAHGMFRWVACQLEALKRCLKVGMIRKALTDLPKTLDETYARLLMGIDEAYRHEAKSALLWLCFSERPLQLAELAEGAVITSDNGCRFSSEERFPDSQYILDVLSSLVVVSYADGEAASEDTVSHVPKSMIIVSLAHLSIKEYLISERIGCGAALFFSTSNTVAQTYITECTLNYMLHCHRSEVIGEWADRKIYLPLLDYSLRYWHKHIKLLSSEQQIKFNPMVMELLRSKLLQSRKIQSYRPDTLVPGRWRAGDDDNTNPLYFACDLGLYSAVKEFLLLEEGFSRQFPREDYLLPRAICGRNPKIVSLILEQGKWRSSDVDLGTMLHLAVHAGVLGIVEVLLNHGVEINIADKLGQTPLHRAAETRRSAIAHYLLDAGAKVNTPAIRDQSRTPLHWAAFHKDIELLSHLITLGADVNAQNASGETALHYAALHGDLEVMTKLLDSGALPDIATDDEVTPLAWAVAHNNHSAVDILLAFGAKVGLSLNDIPDDAQFNFYTGSEAR